MCGIAGIWHPDRKPVNAAALRRMTRTLTHRGPDGEGFHTEPGIGLGHRRLSIIDIAGGAQPLSNGDQSIWVSFNGEIFNYIELREDLERRGYQFRTRSDTETLVHLYQEHGLDFVHSLIGQFAIALWDQPRRRLILARDRVGIRPLFHSTLADGSVLFGSEMKALIAHGDLRAEIDPVAAGQVADFWVSVPPRTTLKGIEELPPGCMLILDEQCRRMHKYWRHEFPREHEYEERSFEAWSKDVEELVEDAVRLRLRSDVQVGSYLSGGLDSSILTALVKRDHINDLTTFSVGFSEARFDEREYQNQVVRYLHTDHRHVEVDAADIAQAFTDVVWFAERPIMRTAPAPLYRLAKLAQDSGVKVVLTGEGADEVFGGYNIFREDKARRFWAREPDSRWRSLAVSSLYGYLKRDPRADAMWRRFFSQGIENIDDPYYSHRLRWSGGAHIKRLLSRDLVAQMQSDEETTAELEAYLEPDLNRWHPLCRAQYLEMALFMSGYLLSSQGDRMMMGQSIEGRVPFLDHRLIELAARIPPKFKIRGLNEKHILKKTFADIVPDTVVARPKQPFRAPISHCFSQNRGSLGASLLETTELEKSGLANAAGVGKLLEKSRAGQQALAEREEMALAIVTSLQLIHHLFIEQFDAERAQDAA